MIKFSKVDELINSQAAISNKYDQEAKEVYKNIADKKRELFTNMFKNGLIQKIYHISYSIP